MEGDKIEKVMSWAKMGEVYSLTRIYLKMRKLHGVSREDPNYRRFRPCLHMKHLPNAKLIGRHVVVDRNAALDFCLRLQEYLSTPYHENIAPSEVEQYHPEELLGITFLALHQQEYGTREWSNETLFPTLKLLYQHLQGSWLPGDLAPPEGTTIGFDGDDYNEIIKALPYRWVGRTLKYLNSKHKNTDRTSLPPSYTVTM